MAWLIRDAYRKLFLSDNRPLEYGGRLFMAERCTITPITREIAELLYGGTLPGKGELIIAVNPRRAQHTLRLGWYATDQDGTTQYFSSEPSEVGGKWYITSGTSEMVAGELLRPILGKLPEYGKRYVGAARRVTPLIGTDVVNLETARRLVKLGVEPTGEIGFVVWRHRHVSTILTTAPRVDFQDLKNYRWEPTFTIGDLEREILKRAQTMTTSYANGYFAASIAHHLNPTTSQVFPAETLLEAVCAALLYTLQTNLQ